MVILSFFGTTVEILEMQELFPKAYVTHKPNICIFVPVHELLMMIAFFTIKSSLVPLIEGLCVQIYFRFEISVVLLTSSCFLFVEEKTC